MNPQQHILFTELVCCENICDLLQWSKNGMVVFLQGILKKNDVRDFCPGVGVLKMSSFQIHRKD